MSADLIISRPEKPPSPNRLSIAHLMLWTFCCAAVLGGYRLALEQVWGGPRAEGLEAPRELLTRLLVYYGFYSLPLGAQAAGVLLWSYRSVTGRGGFPTEPGHWLLIAEGIEALGSLPVQLIVFSLAAFAGSHPGPWAAALYLPGPVASVMLYGFALRGWENQSKPWRAALIGLLTLRAMPALVLISLLVTAGAVAPGENWYWLMLDSPSWCACLEMPVVILVAVAAFVDPERNCRDFLHWTGVNALIAVALIQLFAAIAWPF